MCLLSHPEGRPTLISVGTPSKVLEARFGEDQLSSMDEAITRKNGMAASVVIGVDAFTPSPIGLADPKTNRLLGCLIDLPHADRSGNYPANEAVKMSVQWLVLVSLIQHRGSTSTTHDSDPRLVTAREVPIWRAWRARIMCGSRPSIRPTRAA